MQNKSTAHNSKIAALHTTTSARNTINAPLVGVIDAQLLERILFENFKPENVQNANAFGTLPHSIAAGGRFFADNSVANGRLRKFTVVKPRKHGEKGQLICREDVDTTNKVKCVENSKTFP